MGQPVYGSVPQQKMADDGNLVGGQPGMLLQPIGAQPMQLMGAQPMQPMGGMSGQPMGGMSGQPMGGAMVGGDPA